MVMNVVYTGGNGILDVERDDGNDSFNLYRNSKVEHLNCPASIFRLAVCVWTWVNAGARECSVGQILMLSRKSKCRSGPVDLIDVTARF